ncbi:MAG TPA: ATP-binding protein [Actinomycetes bacterium]|nr:ATP-binding protein [Actinomycetes bacterium]
MIRRVSLAGQLLILQLGIVLVVAVAAAAVSIAQGQASFRDVQGRRVLSAAERAAASHLVTQHLGDPARRAAVAAMIDGYRDQADASYALVAGGDRRVLAASDPGQVGRQLDLHGSSVLQGRAWEGVVTEDGARSVVAHAPILNHPEARTVGFVAVGVNTPSFWESLGSAAPNLLIYLGVASVLGVAGSLLLARRVKRQTLGLEPRAITRLAEHRDTMLHGLKEGVIGLDPHHRVTLANDEAMRLLELPSESVGRTLAELGVDQRLCEVLSGRTDGHDQIVLLGERVLVLNRVPISSRGRDIGSVTTLRDRTELVSLQRELDVTRTTTETMRAQAHEFSNQLHTISGLIELEEYHEVVRYVGRLTRSQARLNDKVTSRIEDPSVAALLIAKASQAGERGVQLRISDDTRLGRVDELLSADLTTVVGNLVDNALDAIGHTPDGWVAVEIAQQNAHVRVTVRDSGPGVAPELAEEVFEHGFTTKAAADGQRGIGLALIRMVCTRRGGRVSVRNDHGAMFTAELPFATGGRP